MKATYRIGRWFRDIDRSEDPLLTVEVGDFDWWLEHFFDTFVLPDGFYWVSKESGGEVLNWGTVELIGNEYEVHKDLFAPPPSVPLHPGTFRLKYAYDDRFEWAPTE